MVTCEYIPGRSLPSAFGRSTSVRKVAWSVPASTTCASPCPQKFSPAFSDDMWTFRHRTQSVAGRPISGTSTKTRTGSIRTMVKQRLRLIGASGLSKKTDVGIGSEIVPSKGALDAR